VSKLSNPIPPLQRLCVDRRTAAWLLSVSPSLFDKRVKELAYPQAVSGHSPPLWLVEGLLGDKRSE
jgi:hypothetical protein